MAILKVIEVLSESSSSWEDATKSAVAEASKSIKNIKSVYVKEQNAVVDDGKVTKFRVTLKISFELDR